MAFPKIEGYVVTEKLGSGSYSTVYKAYTKVGARTVVAVKCVDKSRLKHSGSAVDNLITEIRLLKTLTHPHIVHMKNFTWDDKNIYIITEYCCGGDLSKYIHRYGRVPEKQVLYFLQQLASALKFLREKGVVHMDLKPHNLLLHKGSDGKYILKVADFGFAQYLSDDSVRSVRGSPLYMAPEMVAGDAYDASVDLWSVGVIMYECLFGKAPYSSNTFAELVQKIHSKAPIQVPRGSSISEGCRDLLGRLLRHDPADRITYEEFFAHPYLDLEHMPSKENYEKAVALIKQAVELDSSGRLEEAFDVYCASLRYLVPAVNSEADAVRRGALRDKVTRYMQRAEEIKQHLKGAHTVGGVGGVSVDVGAPSAGPDGGRAQRALAACCVRGALSTDTYHIDSDEIKKRKLCSCADASCACAAAEGGSTEDNKTASPRSQSGVASERSPGRSALRRLFGRQLSFALPPWEATDPANEDCSHVDKAGNKANNETANDACRIA